MARIRYVKKAQQRYATKPVLDATTGEQVRVPLRSKRTGEQLKTKHGALRWQRQTVRDTTKPLPMPRCDYCGKEIAVGSAYRIVKLRFGARYRHAEHPSWQPWDLSSAMWARIAQVVDGAEKALNDWSGEDTSEVESILADAASEMEGLAEEREESAENMEQGFGHETEKSTELREHADNIRDYASELENWSWSGDDRPDEGDFDSDEEQEQTFDEALEEWMEEVRESAREALSETPDV
jgi:hypothetical protein